MTRESKIFKLLHTCIEYINEFFTDIITDPKLKNDYEKDQFDKLSSRLILGHIFTTLLFLSFAFFDLFIIKNKEILFELTIIRLVIIFFVLIPFFFVLINKKLKKYTRPLLLVTYLTVGYYIIYTSYRLNINQLAFFHNYLALNIIIIGLFVLLTIKAIDTLIISFFYIIGYNLVHILTKSSNLYYINNSFSNENFLDANIWLISVTLLGYFLWRLNSNLSKLNFIKTHELQQQQLKLEEANNVKNKFFSIVTHDLKNLISSQYSLANYMHNKYKSMPNEKMEDFISMIENSAHKTLNVFEELLVWVRAQTNRIVIAPTYLNLYQLITDVTELMQINLNKKKINIINNVPYNSVAFCDENTLKTVIRNVLGNAVKFSHPSSKIEISIQEYNTNTVLIIRDFGIGLSPEELSTLFSIENTYSRKGTQGEDGTGLGLILCKELLKLNSGDIYLESEKNIGTSTYIILQTNKNQELTK